MRLLLFSIHDTATGSYGAPFAQHTHGEAERTFKRLASDTNSNIHQFPEQFDLYHLGEFDDGTGKAEMLPAPKHIMKANALLN